MQRKLAAVTTVVLASGLVGCGSGSAKVATAKTPKLDPATFVRGVDNPWFPLTPGTTYRYKGVKDGMPSVDVFSVTHRTKRILGVETTVVRDRLYLKGKLGEDTVDWYAQDQRGNVWYLGEDTKELDPSTGKVKSTEGSWQAGVNGARAGIFMPANPTVGQKGQQEYYKGHAEDRYKVLSLDAPVQVPFGSTQHALQTKEWTPLEPGVVDNKYYMRGVGTVREVAVQGGNERDELVSVTKR
jgi:hypothetical protein